MAKWIGEAALTVQAPRRFVCGYRFHVRRAGLRSPFDEFFGFVDENLDPGGGQSHSYWARLPIFSRHGCVDEEWGAAEVKPSDTAKVPQLAGTKRSRVPPHRCVSVWHDQ